MVYGEQAEDNQSVMRPSVKAAQFNFLGVLQAVGPRPNYKEAMASFERAVALEPDNLSHLEWARHTAHDLQDEGKFLRYNQMLQDLS